MRADPPQGARLLMSGAETDMIENGNKEQDNHRLVNKLFSLMALARALEADLQAEATANPDMDPALADYPGQFMKAVDALMKELDLKPPTDLQNPPST